MNKPVFPYIVLAGILAAAGGCIFTLFFYTPALDWDRSPKALAIETAVTAQHIDTNYIPGLRIWGNGDSVWATIGPDGRREVYKGHASAEELSSILKALNDVGFFKLSKMLPNKKEYRCSSLGPDDLFLVHLTSGTYSEAIWTADDRTCDLLHRLTTNEFIQGSVYVPSVGKLYVLPVEKADFRPTVETFHQWPDAEFGYSLETVYNSGNNQEIHDKALAFAWDIVNSGHPVVVSNGKKFWIAVMVEGITKAWGQ